MKQQISTNVWIKRILDGEFNLQELMIKHRGSLNAIFKETGIPWSIVKQFCKDIKIEIKNKRNYKITDLDKSVIDGVIDDYINAHNLNYIYKKYFLTKRKVRSIIATFSNEIIKQRREYNLDNNQQEFVLYTNKVRSLTKSNLIYLNFSNKEGFHWNHIFSVLDGFTHNVPEDIIASPINLELITEKENLTLGYNSKITLDELRERVRESFLC